MARHGRDRDAVKLANHLDLAYVHALRLVRKAKERARVEDTTFAAALLLVLDEDLPRKD